MKKAIIVALMLGSIIALQTPSQAEEIGIGDVIFEEQNQERMEHGFLINELSYTAVKLHLLVADKDLAQINNQGEVLETIKRLEELTKTDVITILDLAKNKEEALTSYLKNCDEALQKGDTTSAYMRQEMEIIKRDMEGCLKDKEISDTTYFEAIDRYDEKIMDISLTDSIKYENCATENRIQYNAKTSIVRKLVFYLGLLQQKYDILFQKQEIMTKNFTVFRDDILPDLNEINKILQQYDF